MNARRASPRPRLVSHPAARRWSARLDAAGRFAVLVGLPALHLALIVAAAWWLGPTAPLIYCGVVTVLMLAGFAYATRRATTGGAR